MLYTWLTCKHKNNVKTSFICTSNAIKLAIATSC